ncbi:Rho GTPase activation protein [Xylaria sp. FL1777]|nr:Rho GTPase activation protein [Xylaria sp. FL1777]
MDDTISTHRDSSPSEWSQSTAGDAVPQRSSRVPSNNSTRASLEPGSLLQSSIRAVTPDPAENGLEPMDMNLPAVTRGFGALSPQSSPRSIRGGERRRQGIVFPDEVFSESFDSTPPSPPSHRGAPRPRTRTLDEALALRQTPSRDPTEIRHRSLIDSDVRPTPTVLEPAPHGARVTSRPPDVRTTTALGKDKWPNSNRLAKRGPSRPTSPMLSPPSVDSLLLPIPTDDANRILSLMRRLCGRMKGEVEYQSDPTTPWYEGIFYIDEDKGSLMFDSGHNGPFHITIISDLRGCRVHPCKPPDDGLRCLELSSIRMGVEIIFRPLSPDDIDLWLASLLCWQQIRPPGARLTSGRGSGSPGFGRPSEARKRGSSMATHASKDAAIIKVGNVMLWDKGAATSPRAIVRRPSTRDLRSGSTSWRRVSCILQDNGEFKLMTENDVTVLSVIDLSQLSRSAVQRLDRSVLEEDFCIAVFPVYSATAKQLSIFRPVYLSLDSRVLFEVWFVLLRAFTVPELYGIKASTGQITEILDYNTNFDGQLFRIENSIEVKVTEAKLQRGGVSSERHLSHKERDPLIGHYLAEVVLDGDVRSRTTTQADTKNPFWRETVQFSELPATLPCLSVVLKRLDGNLDSLTHQVQASLGLPKSGNLTETVCGVVEIPLDKMEKGKDYEEWYPVYDERQESVGSMFIKLDHTELIVLTAKDYEPLSELLHRFSTGLTTQITHTTPGMLRRLSEIFLNIFQVSGTASEWLMALVEDEIDGVGNQNSIKRLRFSRRMKSNESSASASDREQLVRDKEYLEDVLGDKIFEINEINPDCEVDPSRIEKVEDIQQHWKLLIQLTTELWEIISASANKLPLELRGVLKYVRAVAEDRYGDFLRTVNYTSVSGFLFLRFICPAILNPKLFGLLRDNPRPRAQRTLTLIAKGLQALANLSSFGKKESWMEYMNKFLGHHRQSFKNFIDQLCSVPSDRYPITVPASYSTPIMILGRLPPQGREGFPSLPYLIDHQRNYAALAKLWLESHPASSADSHLFEGELEEFHTLCVGLQRRSDECMAQVEMFRATEDESVITDDLAENLERVSLNGSFNPSYASSAIWAEHDPYQPPGSSGSEAEANRVNQRSYIRETSSLLSEGLDFSKPMGTIRAKARPGKETRRFLSGLIGNKKSKEGSGLSSTVRDKSKNKGDKSGRSILGNFSESRQQNDTDTRH